jgi:hypothetical protein
MRQLEERQALSARSGRSAVIMPASSPAGPFLSFARSFAFSNASRLIVMVISISSSVMVSGSCAVWFG